MKLFQGWIAAINWALVVGLNQSEMIGERRVVPVHKMIESIGIREIVPG